jgi:hypothetical protein
MRGTLQGLCFAVVAGLLAAPTSAAAVEGPEPRAVETETITVPPDQAAPEPEAEPGGASATPRQPTAPADLPAIEYDVSKLPTPVRRIREQIIAAAATGDLGALRTIFDAQDQPPQLGGDDVGDPIAHLASLSGDAEGREILAILIEVFEAGYVRVDAGTPQEMYVWPYFASYPVDALTPPQLVELFKLVYAGDYEDMLAYGLYTSFRAGISPDGTWRYFFTD